MLSSAEINVAFPNHYEITSRLYLPPDGRSFSSKMYQPIPTPTELTLASDSRGVVKKRLVLRNVLYTDIVIKFIVANNDSGVIRLEHDTLRIAARSLVHVEMSVDVDKIGTFCRSTFTLTGYVRPVHPSNGLQVFKWARTPNAELLRQKAFSLNIRFSDDYSAFETIIDLPGMAHCIEPQNRATLAYDESELDDAIAIDADVTTAKDCASIMDFFEEVRANQANPGVDCWVANAATRLAKSLHSQYLAKKPYPREVTGIPMKPIEYDLAPNMHVPVRSVSRIKNIDTSDIIMCEPVTDADLVKIQAEAEDVKRQKKAAAADALLRINTEMNATPCGGSE